MTALILMSSDASTKTKQRERREITSEGKDRGGGTGTAKEKGKLRRILTWKPGNHVKGKTRGWGGGDNRKRTPVEG